MADLVEDIKYCRLYKFKEKAAKKTGGAEKGKAKKGIQAIHEQFGLGTEQEVGARATEGDKNSNKK